LSNNQKYKKKEDIEYGKKSHMEFVKIMTENKDPINVKGKGGLRPITMEEVKSIILQMIYGQYYLGKYMI